ncbi:DUF4073 domain-containing protein [Paenibacillus nanensis]|uniref:DUF4073 domain-containing protein n=1 Tax=Paenibacillus nanensis TaxID=393251 RepID=A0A3A1UX63_9BACL|nr:DUF4073 domain-containing protein [Paenibacillus nanensis]RIX52785.1 DUF4073 domain-containing protein [Paenibacillus nanensis]
MLLVSLIVFSSYSTAFAADRLVQEPVAADSVTGDPGIRYGDYISTSDGGYVAAGTDEGGEEPELFMAKWDANGELQWRTSLGFDSSDIPPAVNDLLETPNGYMFVGRMNDGMLYGLVNETGGVVKSGVQLPGGGSANFIAAMDIAGTVRYLVGGIASPFGSGTVNSIFILDANGNPGAGIVHLTNYGRIPFDGVTLASGDVAIVGYGSEGTGSSYGMLYTYAAGSGAGSLKKFTSGEGSLTLQAVTEAEASSGYYLLGNVLEGSEQNIVVIRTDGEGNELWRKEYSHAGPQVPEGMLRTRDGGFLIYGGSNAGDGVLLKTDANMNEQWFKVLPDTWNLQAALQLADGSYRVAGSSANLIDIRVGPPAGLALDDEANVITGMTEDMEYLGNGNAGYVVFDSDSAPTFPGDQTVFVRYKADPAAGYEAGESIPFVFTANPVTIASVSPLTGISVEYGTPLTEVGLPTTVDIGLSDGTDLPAGVTWDGGVPSYDGSTAGEYVFTGTLTPPAGVTNPEGHTATVIITVEEEPVKLVGLEVDEDSYRLRVGSSHITRVEASYSDGHRVDVTDSANYTTSNASVAEVEENGIVRAKSPGTATISAEYGGLRSEVQVEVYSPPGDIAPVVPIFTDKTTMHCPSGGCTVTFGNEVSIEIPGLSGDAIVTIEKIKLPSDLVPAEMKLASEAFELLVNTGTTFSEPVTLRFAFNAAAVPKGFRAALFYYDEAREEWVEIESRVEDGVVVASVDHFTKFAVFGVELPEEPTPTRFLDMDGHWAESVVARAAELGIASGYDARTFAPDAQVTRAQFVTMLMRALKADSLSAPHFADAESIEAWAASSIAAAAERGIVVGFSDGTFRPNAVITRAEMVTLLARAAGLETSGDAKPTFADAADIPTWARAAVAAAEGISLVQGRDGNRFEPFAAATRAEAVFLLMRMLDLNEAVSGK